MSSWIQFEGPFTVAGRKTPVWMVVTAKLRAPLGWIRFYPQWRKYAFFPVKDSVFEKTCLREIADFCAARSSEYRNRPAESSAR